MEINVVLSYVFAYVGTCRITISVVRCQNYQQEHLGAIFFTSIYRSIIAIVLFFPSVGNSVSFTWVFVVFLHLIHWIT